MNKNENPSVTNPDPDELPYEVELRTNERTVFGKGEIQEMGEGAFRIEYDTHISMTGFSNEALGGSGEPKRLENFPNVEGISETPTSSSKEATTSSTTPQLPTDWSSTLKFAWEQRQIFAYTLSIGIFMLAAYLSSPITAIAGGLILILSALHYE